MSRRPAPRILILGAALALAVPALAGKLSLFPGMGGVPDLGSIRCATYNDMYPKGPNGLRQATLYWIEGYVYARTGKGMDQFLAGLPGVGSWDFESLTGHVVAYCRDNADAPVHAAVDDLWATLSD